MKNIITSIMCAASLFVSTQLYTQDAPIPYHFEQVNIDFGVFQGGLVPEGVKPQERNEYPFPVFEAQLYTVETQTIESSEKAPWIQLQFAELNLDMNSYITITSTHDGDKQFLNTQSAAVWQNHTAYFKGNKVVVQLFVAPGDKNVQLNISRLVVGDFVGGMPIDIYRSQCGPDDDRSSSSTPEADGRIMPLGCSGWLTAAGFYLTAGHCLDGGSSTFTTFEFDVPASLCDGTTQPAAIANQYPIIASSIAWRNDGLSGGGDDWGIFNCGTNSNTGFTPNEGRRAYYHLSKDHTVTSAANIRIRGFGTDNVPLGCGAAPPSGNGRNSDNQTLQWHGGPNVGETAVNSNYVYWEYQVDTEGGNSGSAISLWDGTAHAIGIHTNAGCDDPIVSGDGNTGTSFETDDLEAAMNSYFQSQVEYVDIEHFGSYTIGSSVRPHFSVQNAVNQANAGNGVGRELILIAGSNEISSNTNEGVYQEAFNYSGLSNGVLLRRTVGAVKIGPNATPFSSNAFARSNASEENRGN